MKSKTFRQGGHIPHFKSDTEHQPIVTLPVPERVIIPLSQHIGAPCDPLPDVRVGDRVTVGQPIGMGKGLCAPVHASVSGYIEAIEERPHVCNRNIMSIVIRREGDDTWNEVAGKGIDELSAQEIVDIIGQAGIVGMGGAGFPTRVKLSPPPNKHIDTLLLNGAECEPFLTSDHRYMLEHGEDVILGLKAAMKATAAQRAFIGIEDNKPDAIAHLQSLTAQDSNIAVVPLETKYPQGGEKQLIYSILRREVPTGGLPMDVGAIVQNIGTAVAISEAVKWRKPLIERVVTLGGPGVLQKGNYLVRIGTPLSYLLDKCGVERDCGVRVIVGGPMTGVVQSDLEAPVIKTTGGVLAFTPEFGRRTDAYSDCVRCGKCVEQCPMYLYPNDLGLLAEAERIGDLDRRHVLDCIECGLCSYVCPSNRPIVQFIKLAKPAVWAHRNRLATGSGR